MKALLFGFKYPGVFRVTLLMFMLSTIINLFGDHENSLKECPLEYDYEITYPNGTDTYGSELLFTYTISLNPDLTTEFDTQRTYSLYSDYFSTDTTHSMLIPLDSDVQNGETFTYSQFPLTKHLTVRLEDGVVEIIIIRIEGSRVEGCPDDYIQEDGNFIQQSSELIMGLQPPNSENEK